MKYIQQAFNYQYSFWRYIIGTLLVIIAVTLGQIPLTWALISKIGLKNMMGMEQMELLASLESNYAFFLIMLTYALGLGAILLIVKYLHGQPLRALTTARKKIDWKRVGFTFSVVAVFSVITIFIDYFLNPQNYQWNFQPTKFLILLAISIIMVPLQTSFEEYLFRGYLMQGLGTLAKNRWLPLFLTSLIFGGLHFFNPEVAKLGNITMVSYIGTGFMLGIMTLMDEGIELSLGFHAANNLIIALLLTADWTAFQTYSILKDISNPSAGWDIFIQVLVFYPLLLWVLARKYAWKNWKKRLFGKVEPLCKSGERAEV